MTLLPSPLRRRARRVLTRRQAASTMKAIEDRRWPAARRPGWPGARAPARRGAAGAQRADPIRCRGRPGRSAGPDGDPRVVEHQAGLVVDQAGREAEGGSGVVIAWQAAKIG